MLTIFGTVALDTTRTPFHTVERTLGGTATFASISASNYTPTSLIGIVGHDFPESYLQLLKDRLDIRGLTISQTEKTFHYDSSFGYDLAKRTTNKTELNVRSEEHTSELQSQSNLVCRLLLEKKNTKR